MDAEAPAPHRYRLVVFDFDGTLADTYPWFAGAIGEAALHYGFRSLDAGEMEALRGLPGREFFRRLGVPWWKIPIVARGLRERMGEEISRIRLFEGVERMLDELGGCGLSIGILSSNSADNVRRVLGPRCLGRIRYLECGTSLQGKAHRLARMLRAARMESDRALYIGDEIRDLEAARRLKVTSGAVTWGYNTAEVLRRERPDLLFDRVEEIAPRLCAPSSDSKGSSS